MCDNSTPIDQTRITRIVEGALLASPQPLTRHQLRALFDDEPDPLPPHSIDCAIERLQLACAERGLCLVEVASGLRFQIPADIYPWVKKLANGRKTKYSRATLETLAVIAYRQPITRGDIEKIRGVAVSSQIIQTLEEREWIRVVGHRDIPGRPALLGTTKLFLDYFGLQRLEDLPPLSELTDITAFDREQSLHVNEQAAEQDSASSHATDTEHGLRTAPDATEPTPTATLFSTAPSCDEVTQRIAEIGSNSLEPDFEPDSITPFNDTASQPSFSSSEAISPMPDSMHDHPSFSTPSAARSLNDE